MSEQQSSADSAHADWHEGDYRRARDCMHSILQNAGVMVPTKFFDKAFQQAVGILSLTDRRFAEPQSAPKLEAMAGKVERIARMMRKSLPHIPFCEPDIKDLEQAAAGLRSQAVIAPQAAIENLTNHQVQCDQDGVMIQVSRQALDEVLSYVALTRPKCGDGQ